MIAIIDYGMGNLRSVQKACERLGFSAHIVSNPEAIEHAHKLILPGVGAFHDAMQELARRDLVAPLRRYLHSDRPFLGICLGLQLLFEYSYEDGHWPGLGILAGNVVRFPESPGLKVPHMGWNTLQIVNPQDYIWRNLSSQPSMYFVHSYYVIPDDSSVVAAWSDHGVRFTAMIRQRRIWATQFHPEKSQQAGLQLLRNFLTDD